MSIKRIHTIKSKLKLTEAQYRALLMRVAGVTSSKDLTPDADQAVTNALLQMEKAGDAILRHRPKTPQEAKIWAVWLGTDDNPGVSRFLPLEKRTPAYLAGVIGRFGEVVQEDGHYRFDKLTKREASKAIEALNGRLAYEKYKTSQCPNGRPPIDRI